MRVGITGGTGFIGEYLIRDYGKEIQFVAPVIENPIDISRAEYRVSDYSVDSLKYFFEGCDAVIHLAAKVAKKNAMQMTMDEYIQNTVLTANVFEACRLNGISNIIHASSRAIFDWSNNILSRTINEKDIPKPQNVYGVSKVCDEVLAEFYNNVYGMKIKSYRMAEVCGYDLKYGMINAFWDAALKNCVEGKSIKVYGTGLAGRDLLYVKDAARAFYLGLYHGEKGVYHIGSGELTTNKDIAYEFCKVFDNKSGIELLADKEEWGTSGVLNVEKASKELGFHTEYDLPQIIRDIKVEYSKCSKK